MAKQLSFVDDLEGLDIDVTFLTVGIARRYHQPLYSALTDSGNRVWCVSRFPQIRKLLNQELTNNRCSMIFW